MEQHIKKALTHVRNVAGLTIVIVTIVHFVVSIIKYGF